MPQPSDWHCSTGVDLYSGLSQEEEAGERVGRSVQEWSYWCAVVILFIFCFLPEKAPLWLNYVTNYPTEVIPTVYFNCS